MKQVNANLLAFLNSRASYAVADLFLITLQDGSLISWTSYDSDLTVGGVVYSAKGPLIDRTKWGIKNTPEVPEMEILVLSDGADMPDGSNVKMAAAQGLFTFGTVLLSRAFMPAAGNVTLGAVDIFLGNIAEVDVDAISIRMTVKGANVALGQYMPRNTFNTPCIHNLFDKGCAPNPGQAGGGPAKSAYTVASAVGAGSTPAFINWPTTVPPNPTNFNYGWITFTSGANKGASRSITQATTLGLALIPPLNSEPAEGDTFNAVYGCSKTRSSTGCAFFNNLQHYRGFPYVPPETYGV